MEVYKKRYKLQEINYNFLLAILPVFFLMTIILI